MSTRKYYLDMKNFNPQKKKVKKNFEFQKGISKKII